MRRFDSDPRLQLLNDLAHNRDPVFAASPEIQLWKVPTKTSVYFPTDWIRSDGPESVLCSESRNSIKATHHS